MSLAACAGKVYKSIFVLKGNLHTTNYTAGADSDWGEAIAAEIYGSQDGGSAAPADHSSVILQPDTHMMNAESFCAVLRQMAEQTGCCPNNRFLLTCDGHESHIGRATRLLAEELGFILYILPGESPCGCHVTLS